MIYRELALPPAAAGAAQCAWRFQLEARDPPRFLHHIPPDGTTNLILSVAPDGGWHTGLIGPTLKATPVEVAAGWAYAGVRLRPEAASAVSGIAPVTIVGQLCDRFPGAERLAALFRDLAALTQSPSDEFMHWRGQGVADALAGLEGTDDIVAEAVERMLAAECSDIGSLASDLGLGERQFRRRFTRATGLSPKQFAGVQRVRRAMILSLAGGSWAETAHDAGFADQPHLSRAVRRTFGSAPGIIGGYIGAIRHEFLAPAGVRFVQDEGSMAG